MLERLEIVEFQFEKHKFQCEYIETELNKNPKSKIIDDALSFLAENVGCAEDFERYEENFVNRFANKDLLTKEQIALFYNNTNRRQGQNFIIYCNEVCKPAYFRCEEWD